MTGHGSSKRKLSCIRGGKEGYKFGQVIFYLHPEANPPFQPEAVIREEDSYLVMSAQPEALLPREHPVRVMTDALEMGKEKPGSIIIRPGKPLCMLAIVYDFDLEPAWQGDWFVEALERIWELCSKHQLRQIELPLLGCDSGFLPCELALDDLLSSLPKDDPTPLKVWLRAPPHQIAAIRRRLQQY